MSFTLDKRILRTLIAVAGLIASGAVIAECPDPVGRWAGTFQTYNADTGEQSEHLMAVRLRADGTMKLTLVDFTPTNRRRDESPMGGIWEIDMLTGSCMLELKMMDDLWAHQPDAHFYGPFVDRRTVKMVVFFNVFGTSIGQGTLHKVSFLR